uniref:Uncharacterized protein n=1 Tax=Leersia perrieri TaxID=77586 RepID=A0A0D9W365_9ORYZ
MVDKTDELCTKTVWNEGGHYGESREGGGAFLMRPGELEAASLGGRLRSLLPSLVAACPRMETEREQEWPTADRMEEEMVERVKEETRKGRNHNHKKLELSLQRHRAVYEPRRRVLELISAALGGSCFAIACAVVAKGNEMKDSGVC